MTHFELLQRLLSFVWHLFSDELKSAVEVIGELFDDILWWFDFVESQIDVYEATLAGTLPDFERFYRCTPIYGDTVSERRNRVIAAMRRKGGFNRTAFENIAKGLGYTIGTSGTKHLTLTEGDFKPFRADISMADIDKVYDQTGGYNMYAILVTGTGVETDIDLQNMFDRIHCAGTNFIYQNI